jgi:hypothetical protein
MPDLFELLGKRWKQILIVMILSLLAVGIITYLKPLQYLSTTTSVAASTYNSDRSRIFNRNIAELYSDLGTTDDLDLVVGTGKLDTVYLTVTDQFNLFDHYRMKEKGDAARTKAAYLLKKNTRISKSEYGELKVKVWDTDKNLAPQLANAITDKLQSIHTDLKAIANQNTLAGLQTAIKRIGDSSKTELKNYEALAAEYQLMVDSRPPALLIVEKARPSGWPDRPRRLQIMVATAFLSFFFGLLAALVFDRKKTFQQ